MAFKGGGTPPNNRHRRNTPAPAEVASRVLFSKASCCHFFEQQMYVINIIKAGRLIKLDVGRPLSRQREFHPKPLTEPYVKLSLHTARVIQSYRLKDSPMIKHCGITYFNFLYPLECFTITTF